jgi:hypothetical protein
MSIVVHDNSISTSAMKVRFLLAVLSLDNERRHVPIAWPREAWSTQLRGGFYPAERIGLMHADIEQGGGRPEDPTRSTWPRRSRERAPSST